MPRYPHHAQRVDQLPGSIFEKFLPKMREKGADLVKLHIGDSYRQPPYPLPISDSFTRENPYFNRYCNTLGIPELRRALAQKLSEDNQIAADPDAIMLTAGACSALNIGMMGLVNPGEEVLLLTPCWPFFVGMVKMAGGVPVQVPFYDRLYAEPDWDIAAHLEQFITPKTVALYLNTPNNPSGKVLDEAQLQQIVAVVKKHNLWLISDEAYDGMTYDGRAHISIAANREIAAQTLSIFTFSKVYMFAGLRLGYLVADPELLKQLNKVMVHQYYSPATIAQQMMIEPVQNRREWQDRFVQECQATRNRCSELLKADHHLPEGAYYLFFSIKDYLSGRDYWQVIDDCLDAGISVAPGSDFGQDYPDFIRVCFAGEPPQRIELAMQRLNRVLLG